MTSSKDPFLNLLDDWLQKAALPERSSGRLNGTKAINGALINFCWMHRVYSAREVDLRLFHHDDCNWRGKLDWVMRPKHDATSTYAIEIDSCNKKKSLEKLLKARQLQYIPVWVRWNAALTIHIPEEVVLIDLVSSEMSEKHWTQERAIHGSEGMPWTKARDEELVAHFKTGAGAMEIASNVKRTPGAVRARLVRLGLIANRKNLQD